MAGFIDRITNIFKPEATPQPEAAYRDLYDGFPVVYDGEKTSGELGFPKTFILDYSILRVRSWQALLESEIAHTVLNKFSAWAIGDGLKLQANPNITSLASEGVSFKKEQFNEDVEARWAVWANSKLCSHNGMQSLGSIAKDAFTNVKVGGDVLVILRYEKGFVTVQLIDGAHVQSPSFGSDYFSEKLSNGNTVRNGVEFDSTGRHVAYYVQKDDGLSFDRVVATDAKTGLTVAYLVYGSKYRLDNTRGIPKIAPVLETLAKLERYKEAAVGSAEERAKIVYQIVHNLGSTGESPLQKVMARASGLDTKGENPTDIAGKQLAGSIAASTNKTTFNMPINSELKSLQSNNEMFFAEFYKTNADIICACFGIPPNVAFSLYNDSFSASRAATKDWEHTLKVERNDFSEQFYAPIYAMVLFTEIMKNKIRATGYIDAYMKGNKFVLEAFTSARWTGDMFPHIDPEKEARAERLKLGNKFEGVPLTTVENAVEVLNSGDSDSNIEQASEELKMFEKMFPAQQQTAITVPAKP